jgi:hypothetical protein
MSREAVTLVIRKDGTYDYYYAPGYDNTRVANLFRQIAEQIESGCCIEHSEGLP